MASLSDWLSKPFIEIRITPSDELAKLRSRVSYLEAELVKVQALYGKECNYNMRLLEILRDNGIDWR